VAVSFRDRIMSDPTIRSPGFDLPRQLWSILNRFGTEQHWRRKGKVNVDL